MILRHSILLLVLLLALLTGVIWASPVRAQAVNNPPYEVNIRSGVMIPDDDLLGDDEDAAFQLGVSLARNLGSGFGVQGNFDWAPATDVSFPADPGFETDVHTYLYSGELTYTFPTPDVFQIFVAGGAGAATVVYDDIPPGNSDDSSTSFLLPISGGFRSFLSPNLAIRVEVKDNIIFMDAADSPFLTGSDTEDLHNVQLTAGLSFFLGGP